MKICANCFKDEEIRDFIINSSSEDGECGICGNNGSLINLEELYDFFIEFFGLFSAESGKLRIGDLIERDWKIFSSSEAADAVINEFFQLGLIPFGQDTKVDYIDQIKDHFNLWENLKDSVKNKFRFFTDLSAYHLDVFLIPNERIEKGKIFYRARILPENLDCYQIREMGCPPPKMTKAGRANPLGIPYLYLCEQPETTLYETRSVFLDKVCIGTFQIERTLNIFDFTSAINPFYAFTEGDISLVEIIKRKIVIDAICKDLSKPLRRFDTELEYVPTQVVCEICKMNNADGILFKSSLHPSGINLVLFNPNDAVCKDINIVEINRVTIESQHLSGTEPPV